MSPQNPHVLLVCVANYCRSPVLECIFREKFGHALSFSSAGLQPLPKADMDPRSRAFLLAQGFSPRIHNPKPLSPASVKRSQLILAADMPVLQALNRKYKRHTKKIKLATLFNPKIGLPDPFKAGEQDYQQVMEGILELANSTQAQDLIALTAG
jgi:protein-tyrosine-phosphatase